MYRARHTRTKKVTYVLFAFMVLLLTLNGLWVVRSTWAGAPETLGPEKIFRDFQQQKISKGEYARYLLYFLYSPSKLPSQYSPKAGQAVRCGTIALLEIEKFKDFLSPIDRRLYEQSRARPTLTYYYDTPEGHFRIHYDTTGTHAVYQASTDVNPADGVPDFVNRAAESAEYVYEAMTTANGPIGLDYDEPPLDGSSGGGTNRYDFYFQALGIGLYGVTITDGSGSGTYPSRPGAMKSYIELHKNFFFAGMDPVLALQVTIAHEYQHAVQFAYNANADSAFMENCATNMEENLYDNINDYYSWLNPRYNKPHARIREFDGSIEYATCIWPMFITQKYGHNTLKQVWVESINASTIIDAWESAFSSQTGKSLAQIYQEFTTWFLASGAYDDGVHYEEGAAWTSQINTGHARLEADYASLPVSGSTPANAPNRLGCNFIRCDTSAVGIFGVNVSFDGTVSHPDDAWGLSVMAFDSSTGLWNTFSQVADSSGHIDLQIDDPFQNYSQIILIPQNLRARGNGVNYYSYSVTAITQAPVPAISPPLLMLLLIILSVFVVLSAKPFRRGLS